MTHYSLRMVGKSFVRDHSLQENDTLLFEYKSESPFDVLLFNRSTFCKKESSYFVQKICLDVDTADKSKGQKRKKMIEVIEINDDAEKEQKTGKKNRVSYKRYLSNRRLVTRGKRHCFAVVMQPKHVYENFAMVFFHKLMGKYMYLEDKFLILRVMEQMWRSLIHFQNGVTWELICGWENFKLGRENFALGNCLGESDVCVFNSAGRNEDGIYMVDASIFRVVKEVVAPIGVK